MTGRWTATADPLTERLVARGAVLATIMRLTYDHYVWYAGTKTGTAETRYAAQRAVRKALRCDQCGSKKEWVDCDQCGGEDEDVYEDEPCERCGGGMGWYQCPNAENHKEQKP